MNRSNEQRKALIHEGIELVRRFQRNVKLPSGAPRPPEEFEDVLSQLGSLFERHGMNSVGKALVLASKLCRRSTINRLSTEDLAEGAALAFGLISAVEIYLFEINLSGKRSPRIDRIQEYGIKLAGLVKRSIENRMVETTPPPASATATEELSSGGVPTFANLPPLPVAERLGTDTRPVGQTPELATGAPGFTPAQELPEEKTILPGTAELPLEFRASTLSALKKMTFEWNAENPNATNGGEPPSVKVLAAYAAIEADFPNAVGSEDLIVRDPEDGSLHESHSLPDGSVMQRRLMPLNRRRLKAFQTVDFGPLAFFPEDQASLLHAGARYAFEGGVVVPSTSATLAAEWIEVEPLAEDDIPLSGVIGAVISDAVERAYVYDLEWLAIIAPATNPATLDDLVAEAASTANDGESTDPAMELPESSETELPSDTHDDLAAAAIAPAEEKPAVPNASSPSAVSAPAPSVSTSEKPEATYEVAPPRATAPKPRSLRYRIGQQMFSTSIKSVKEVGKLEPAMIQKGRLVTNRGSYKFFDSRPTGTAAMGGSYIILTTDAEPFAYAVDEILNRTPLSGAEDGPGANA